eukprot:762692-Hanusia_phi.AAC.5
MLDVLANLTREETTRRGGQPPPLLRALLGHEPSSSEDQLLLRYLHLLLPPLPASLPAPSFSRISHFPFPSASHQLSRLRQLPEEQQTTLERALKVPSAGGDQA